ncbi:pyruvate carboxylase subunit B [SAR202 cluster bacterium AD-802-E10_MRT_200m]|nr:pyruvate carboxylase subunit B [SAR202 cluster bacterium AD-802-E10_MRT_200m]
MSKMSPLKITDTTFRDAHQSVAATRMRTQDMEPIAPKMNQIGFHSMEVWGGATFDVCTRFLFDDPWERARVLKRLMPQTPLQMLLRGQNLVGYRHYSDDVVEAFVKHAAECGIDIFRIFDALNDERNIATACKAVKAAGKHAQLCICYTVSEGGRLGGSVYNLEYFVNKAKILEAMGADSICLKDMAGLLAPYDAEQIIKALKATLKVPVQLHTHYTSGMASMAALKAAEAGIDVVDACLSPLALRTSQPAVEPLVVSLNGTSRETGLDVESLIELGDYIESLSGYLRPHLINGRMTVVDTRVLTHQVPGGMISNLMSQLREAESLDRLPEVLEELPRVREQLGYPPLVTPTSQIIGVQAVNNVLFGRWEVITDQVKDYCYGLYGRAPVELDPEVVKRALTGYERGSEPVTGRPADYLDPELEKATEATKGLAKDIGDILVYALYPVTGERFLNVKYGLEKLPEDETPSPATQSPQATEVPSPGNVSDRARTFNIYMSGNSYQVTVDPVVGNETPQSSAQPSTAVVRPTPRPVTPAASTPAPVAVTQKPVAAPQPEPPPANLAQGEIEVIAPLPGMVVRYLVEEGQHVNQGDNVVVLEAMKMENALPAPSGGVVKKLCFASGSRVTRGAALVIIGTS